MTSICAKIDFSSAVSKRKQHCAMSHHTLARNFLIDEREQHKKGRLKSFSSTENFPFSFFLPSLEPSGTHTNEASFCFSPAKRRMIFLFVMSSLRWMDEGLTDEADSQMCLFISHTMGGIKRMRTAAAIERAMTAIVLKTLSKLSQAFREKQKMLLHD